MRQRSAVWQSCTGTNRDGNISDDVSQEGTVSPQRNSSDSLPVDAVSRAVEKHHRRTGSGRECGSQLKNEERLRIALCIECECSGQRGRRGKTIDTRRERSPAEIPG